MIMTKNILLIGVGGQGTILMSKILTEGLAGLGYDVKMSEIHGMSQRGGSVTTQIRYGEKVYSPNVGQGEADVLVAFEKAEAIRALPYLREGGRLFMDAYEILPVSVLSGGAAYPHDAPAVLKKAGVDVTVVEASRTAVELGESRAQNIVMLGVVTRAIGLHDRVDWKGLISQYVPAKARETNLAAYGAGLGL
jgi:indolepyruvate ferredoxin oxidoreductase beta subunit